MKRTLLLALYFCLCLGCTSTGNSTGNRTEITQPSNELQKESTEDTENEAGISLLEAVEQSAEKIAGELPHGSRVAIVAFESESNNLSDFIMEEITGALFDRGIEVADRQNLEYVYKELGFQMSGDVSDETAQSIGKFLAAQLVITGQLTNLGSSYRYRASAIHVEKATRDSVTRFTVRNDKEMQTMVTALARQTTVVKVANYGVSEKTAPKTAGTFLDRGILFASRGDYELAIMDFTEALNINPDLSAAYLLRGRALSASVSFVTDIKTDFSGFGAYYTSGIISEKDARTYEKAIADFDQALRLDPNNVNIYKERGFAYREKGDYDKAIADYTQAININPNESGLYGRRGNAYHSKNDFDKAIADYSQSIRLDPNNEKAYSSRGDAYRDKGDFDKAIADYTQAIRLKPDDYDSYNNRGIAYGYKEDLDRAIADFTQAIRLNPDAVSAYTCRGTAYSNKGDFDKAIADYNQAIRIEPNDAVLYCNRGDTYRDKGDFDKAIADYTKALELNPGGRIAGGIISSQTEYAMYTFNSAGIYLNRGATYYSKNDYDRAIADYTQAIRIDPNFAYAYNNRGWAYYCKNDYDRAITDFTQAIRIDPNFALAYDNRGDAYKAKGDTARANADYAKAKELGYK